MKKILFLLSILLLGFVTCIGPEGPEGPRGPAGRNGQNGIDGRDGGGANVYIQDVNVASGDWVWSNTGRYYWCAKSFSFIDQYIYDFGIIKTYIDYGVAQQELPIVRHYEESGFRWTQTTDYEFEVGKITFYVTNSDFFEERPESMLFRVAIIWEEG